MVHDGTVGRIEHVQMTRLSAGTRVPLRPWGWLFDRALGGGWVGAWGSHAVDTAALVLGAEVADVQALLRIDVPERPDADGDLHRCTAEDGFDGVARTLERCVGSRSTAASRRRRTSRRGSRSSVRKRSPSWSVRRASPLPASDGTRESVDLSTSGDGDPHLAPMRRFAEVVRDTVTTGEVPESAPTFSDGRACDAVLDQLRAAPFAPIADDLE